MTGSPRGAPPGGLPCLPADPCPLRPPDPLHHLSDELLALDRAGLLRVPHTAGPPPGALVLCSNDYLGYAALPWPSVADVGGGAGASRLVSGTVALHLEAEGVIAAWLNTPSALLFSSGYAANVGTIAALAHPGDVIVSDALNHASIIDGCRLSGATIAVVPHTDASAVEHTLDQARSARRRWVLTESLFSMDGDTPDLPRLRAICDAYDAALIVDEAHALGIFGPRGTGLCAEAGVRADVLIGTLGKALGLHGAFVAGSSTLCTYLWNRARSFVFSTGVSPTLAAAAIDRVTRCADDDAGRARLVEATQRLRSGLAGLGAVVLPGSHGPILPWILQTPATALAASHLLQTEGVIVQAIRPPTVPPGTARLRITTSACLSGSDIARALDAFRRVLR